MDDRVLNAAARLLAEHGYAGLRIDDVARASGVAKSTIYRRWPSLADLVLDAAGRAIGQRDLPDTGDVLADLAAVADLTYRSLTSDRGDRTTGSIGLDLLRQPGLAERYRRRFVDPLRDHAVSLIRRGVAEGLFAPDVDAQAVVDALAGTLVYRQVVGDPPPSRDSLTWLALAALRPPAAEPLPVARPGGPAAGQVRGGRAGR